MGQCIAMAANMSKAFLTAFDFGVFQMSVAAANKKPYTWLSAEIMRHVPREPNVAVGNVGPMAAAHTGTFHSNVGALPTGTIAAGEPGLASKKP